MAIKTRFTEEFGGTSGFVHFEQIAVTGRNSALAKCYQEALRVFVQLYNLTRCPFVPNLHNRIEPE